MRKILPALVSAVVASLLIVSLVMASSVHLKPVHSEPGFTDGGLTLSSSASLAGLGNTDLVVRLSATADPTATCTNQGGNQAPGQNPAEVAVTGAVSIPASQIKNGNVTFTVVTQPPAQPTAAEAGCPNPNWTAQITDMAFKTAMIEVEQPVGTVVFTVSCVFSPKTVDGAVPESTVSCS